MTAPGADWSAFGEVVRQPDARRDRQFTPNAEYQAGELAAVSIPLPAVPADEQQWRAEIQRVTNLTVPDHRRVELENVRYWGSVEQPQVYCRFRIVDRETAVPAVDAVKILRDLRKGRRKPKPPAITNHAYEGVGGPCVAEAYGVECEGAREDHALGGGGDSAFVLSWNDWQVAKKEGGGTPALAQRLHAAFTAAEARVNELRTLGRQLGQLVIIGGGDIIEGCQIFPNQSYEIDSDRRGQIRNAVALILAGLDQLAGMFPDVAVLAVGGNHGEHRIGGRRTTRHDNDDCAVFEHAAQAASRDHRLGHVRFVIAQDEPAKTLQVGPWILGTTHGHVFGRGAGGPSAKAYRWFQGQAAGRLPAGDADVLLTHHFHHFAAQDWGHTLWLQAPAMDGGSPHFTDSTGLHAKPGMLSFVMAPGSRFQDPQIL